MTYRHAVKDADNNVPFGETLPVHYNALAGLTVEETESLQDTMMHSRLWEAACSRAWKAQAEFSVI